MMELAIVLFADSQRSPVDPVRAALCSVGRELGIRIEIIEVDDR